MTNEIKFRLPVRSDTGLTLGHLELNAQQHSNLYHSKRLVDQNNRSYFFAYDEVESWFELEDNESPDRATFVPVKQ